jgi:heptosyltransferase-3
MSDPHTIIISRTDNIGDVILTLPMTGVLKKHFPKAKIFFIGKAYTKSIIDNCSHIDGFIDRTEVLEGLINLSAYSADAIIHVFPDKEIAKVAADAKIPIRIGTSHRWFHWLYCNKLININRKNSDLHEAQLNIKLLGHLGIKEEYTLTEIEEMYGFSSAKDTFENNGVKTLIIHPKSKGSAREWKLENYRQLIKSLPAEKFKVFVTGTKAEGDKIKAEIPDFFENTQAIDLTGKLTLDELIALIRKADALLACSTGPLHIASALGINAIGLYPPKRPIHPGRWAPIGKKAKAFCLDKTCNACEKTLDCTCINSIEAVEVKNYLLTIN